MFNGVHPNTISVFAAVVGCAAGVAYAATERSGALFALGGVLVLISGLADAVDGIVARQTGRATAFGDFLDHVLDRLVETVILLGLAAARGATPELGVVVTLIVVFNSYVGTQVEASFGRRDYTGLGKGQFVAGLVVGSALLAVWPDLRVPLGQASVSGLDVMLGLIGVLAVQAVGHRLRIAARLARGGDDHR
jgi:phosphatidylglycerophosphate synthase